MFGRRVIYFLFCSLIFAIFFSLFASLFLFVALSHRRFCFVASVQFFFCYNIASNFLCFHFPLQRMYTDVAFSLSLRLLRWTTENVVCFEFPFCMLKARKHFCPTAVRWAFFLHFYSQLQKWPLPLWISRLLFFSFLSMPKIVFVKQGTTAAAAAATHGLNSEGIHFKLYPWTLEAAVVRTRLLQDFLSESMIFFLPLRIDVHPEAEFYLHRSLFP